MSTDNDIIGKYKNAALNYPRVDEDSQSPEPPPVLSKREVHASLAFPNTVCVPSDPVRTDPASKWFSPHLWDGEGDQLKARSDNEVKYFIGAAHTFKSMYEDMDRAIKSKKPDRFVYILAWTFMDQFLMDPNNEYSKLWDMLYKSSKSEMKIRAMLWYNKLKVKDFWGGVAAIIGKVTEKKDVITGAQGIVNINSLDNGIAVHDNLTLRFGSHHQKVMIIFDGEELIAYCGGIDLDPETLYNHDIHCRIKGGAAYDLYKVFVQRWNDHPENDDTLEVAKTLLSPGSQMNRRGIHMLPENHFSSAMEVLNNKQTVQIGRTYGKGSQRNPLMDWTNLVEDPTNIHIPIQELSLTSGFALKTNYRFAPNGEQSAKELILHAIRKASRYIYIEEQYLVDMDTSKALQDALIRGLDKLIIIIAAKPDLPQADLRRSLFLRPLMEGFKDSVHVFTEDIQWELGIHSKLFIIDDEVVITGSANCSRRSYTYDSEVMAGISEQESFKFIYGFTFAHRLRMALWSFHLKLHKESEQPEFADPIASSVHWVHLPERPRVTPYKLKKLEKGMGDDNLWDKSYDPDPSFSI